MVYLLAFTIPSKATYWNVPGEEEQEVVGGGGGEGDAWQMLHNYRNCSMVAELHSLLIAIDGPCYMQGSKINITIVMT